MRYREGVEVCGVISVMFSVVMLFVSLVTVFVSVSLWFVFVCSGEVNVLVVCSDVVQSVSS